MYFQKGLQVDDIIITQSKAFFYYSSYNVANHQQKLPPDIRFHNDKPQDSENMTVCLFVACMAQ